MQNAMKLSFDQVTLDDSSFHRGQQRTTLMNNWNVQSDGPLRQEASMLTFQYLHQQKHNLKPISGSTSSSGRPGWLEYNDAGFDSKDFKSPRQPAVASTDYGFWKLFWACYLEIMT